MKLNRWSLRIKHHFEKAIKQIICMVLIICLSGCWNSNELDTLGIVLGIGIDLPRAESDKVLVTAQMVKVGEISKVGGGGGSQEKKFWNVDSTGETVFQAIREITSKSSRKLFHPHTEVLIFGRSAAEDGVRTKIDYFFRNHEARNKVFVAVSDTTAVDILNTESELEAVPATELMALIDNYVAVTSQTRATRISDFVNCFLSETTSPVAPIISVEQKGESKTLKISGTAVFKDDKMVGALNKPEGRGLMWVLGEVKSGIIVGEDSGGGLESVEIIRSKTKMTPVLKDGEIVIRIEIAEEGNVCEETGTANLSDLSEIAYLENSVEEVIKNEVVSAVTKAKELEADIFGFGDAIKAKYSKQWESMKENWDEMYQSLEIELTVDAKIRLLGKITKPMVPEKG
ncbi:MAG: Ger(x)C family spore germination protein [Clostridia bacterium]|nr:Ger(x)C family spore germination protein [Clostridia bacterium]